MVEEQNIKEVVEMRYGLHLDSVHEVENVIDDLQSLRDYLENGEK